MKFLRQTSDSAFTAAFARPRSKKTLPRIDAMASRRAVRPQRSGMFGRMFPTLPPLTVADPALQALADAIENANPEDPAGKNNATGDQHVHSSYGSTD